MGTRSRELEPGTWSCAALLAPAPPLLALTALHCSQREPAAGRDSLAGRRAIGSAGPHVVQPGAIIGLADCLKKQGPGAHEHLICFNFVSQLSLLISVYTVGNTLQSGARLRTSIHLWKVSSYFKRSIFLVCMIIYIIL